MWKWRIECFHSLGQHIYEIIGTKESVGIRKEFNSHRTGLGHYLYGRRFIVLGHQYGPREITWKHSIMWMVVVTFSKLPPYRSFSHDVTAAIFVYKTMNRRQHLCTKKVLWEMNSLHMLKLSFTPSNSQSCWPRDWKRSIKPCLSRIYFHHLQNAHVSPS